MQIQRCNNCQANPNFTALYINPDKIEKAIGNVMLNMLLMLSQSLKN